MTKQKNKKRAREKRREATQPDSDTAPNWEGKCELCGDGPTVGDTGLCGPCCFGEADTAGGNW